MAKREPTSAEYQHLLEENDALRAEIVRRDQTIDRLRTEIDHLPCGSEMRMNTAPKAPNSGIRSV